MERLKYNVGVSGIGYYLPEKELSNKDLESMMDTSAEWIEEKVGIKTRRVVEKDQALSDLAYPAALQAMKMAKVEPDEIDLIIVCAINHDKRAPATANILQKKLKTKNAACFDINVGGCPGTVYSIVVGQQFISSGMYKNVLVISGEVYSKLLNWSDRNVSFFFGDGVGAVVLKPCRTSSGILNQLLGSDSEWGADQVIVEGGSRLYYSEEVIRNNLHYPKMNNREVWKFGTTIFPKIVKSVTESSNYLLTDLDWVIPHQANINMIKFGMKKMGIDTNKAYTNIDRVGNTGAGSAMIALAEAVEREKIKPGQLIALASFGAGFSWGAALLNWCSEDDFMSLN